MTPHDDEPKKAKQQKENKREKTILMKTRRIKPVISSVLFACALATLVAVAPASGQTTQGGEASSDLGGREGGRLQGTWEMQITLTDCAGHVIRSLPSLIEFVAGGTVVESNGGTPQALKTPGEGVWRHITDHNYAFRFKFFTFNAQNVFTGWTIIAGETTVDRTGDANTGSATVEVYDPNGVLVASLCAETVGTRFEL
jgi:hypothetical protein